MLIINKSFQIHAYVQQGILIVWEGILICKTLNFSIGDVLRVLKGLDVKKTTWEIVVALRGMYLSMAFFDIYM